VLAPCAAATSPVIFPPGKQLAQSSTVVIAVPRSVSCRVTGTDTVPGLVESQAEVTWQVLVRWKGEFKVGDTFRSNESIVGDKPCYYSQGKPLLLYLNGSQPFKDVWWYELHRPWTMDRLKELDTYGKRHGI